MVVGSLNDQTFFEYTTRLIFLIKFEASIYKFSENCCKNDHESSFIILFHYLFSKQS